MRSQSSALVSTIIPVHDRAGMLREAVGSVLAQTHRPIEIVIVDDGSTDETPDVADELARGHAEVRALHVENGGPGRAREHGRRAVTGDFIQYLDSDDLLHPRKFEASLEALANHRDAGVAYGRTRLVDENGQVLEAPYKRTGEGLTSLYPALLVERWWNTHTPLYRRAVCDRVGPWSDMRRSEDWEYDARVGALGTVLVHCPEDLSDTRKHPGARLTGGPLQPDVLRDLARLLPRLHTCGLRAGVPSHAPEMRTFSRWCFLTARQCAAAGLVEEARHLSELSRNVAEGFGGDGWDVKAYRTLSAVFGWRLLGRLSELADQVRSGTRS